MNTVIEASSRLSRVSPSRTPRLELVIQTPSEKLTFTCICHKTDKPEDRVMGIEFYQRCASEIPQGTHFELELLPGPWECEKNSKPGVYHVNPRTGRIFIFCKKHLPDMESAVETFQKWCLESAFSLTVKGEDFKAFVRQFNDDWGTILQVLKNEYQIVAGPVLDV